MHSTVFRALRKREKYCLVYIFAPAVVCVVVNPVLQINFFLYRPSRVLNLLLRGLASTQKLMSTNQSSAMHSSLPLRSSGSQSPQNETQQSSKAIEATIKDLRSRINDLEVILAPLQNMFVNTPGTVGNPRGWLEQTIKHTLAEIRTRSMLIEHYEGLKATYERIEAMPIPEPTTSKLAARPASSSSTTTSSLKKIKAKEHDSLQFKSLYLPGKRKAPINRKSTETPNNE